MVSLIVDDHDALALHAFLQHAAQQYAVVLGLFLHFQFAVHPLLLAVER